MSLSEKQVHSLYSPAVVSGDLSLVQKILDDHAEVLGTPRVLNMYFGIAARAGQVAIASYLADRGASIDGSLPGETPDEFAPVHGASGRGATDAVRWLIDRGAALTVIDEDGDIRCPGLENAAREGHLECVRLLVEAGVPLADCGMIAWELARLRGHTAIVDYLRASGAPAPVYREDADGSGITGDPGEDASGGGATLPDLRRHIELKMLGTIAPDVFQEILPSDPPIKILVLDQFGVRKALVSEGMSRKPMAVPEGSGLPRFAEVVLRLPADWPLDGEAVQEDRHGWPVNWLRRIAHYPHTSGRPLGTTIAFDNGGPVGPGTRFSALLVVACGPDESYVRSSDGEQVMLYDVLPLYPEEMQLHDREGVIKLLTLFDELKVPREVTLGRPSVARPE